MGGKRKGVSEGWSFPEEKTTAAQKRKGYNVERPTLVETREEG